MASRADLGVRIVALALLSASTANCAHGEAVTGGAMPAQAPATFAGAPPTAGFTRFTAEMEPSDTVTFYSLADRDGGVVRVWWAARLAPKGEPGATGRWADSRSCPAVEGVLRAMTGLAPGALTIAGLRAPGAQPRYLADGERYTAWSQAGQQADGSPISVTLSSTGGDLAAWGAASLAALEPCWRSEAPAGPKR